jgi:hypothetical protein
MIRHCRYCGEAIPDGKRLDAEFCSGLCRGRNHRGTPPETATNGNGRTPDKGTKVYLLPQDLDELRGYATRFSPRLRQKFQDATDRVRAAQGRRR